MRDTDLERVVVESGDQCTRVAFVLIFEDLMQTTTVSQAITRFVHHPSWVSDSAVQVLNLEAAVVTILEVRMW